MDGDVQIKKRQILHKMKFEVEVLVLRRVMISTKESDSEGLTWTRTLELLVSSYAKIIFVLIKAK